MRRREGEQRVVTYTPQILECGEDVRMGGAVGAVVSAVVSAMVSAAVSAAVSAFPRPRALLLRRSPVYHADRSVQEGLHWM
jgi:ADP-dependent phosphofructokinase/glucokinase